MTKCSDGSTTDKDKDMWRKNERKPNIIVGEKNDDFIKQWYVGHFTALIQKRLQKNTHNRHTDTQTHRHTHTQEERTGRSDVKKTII